MTFLPIVERELRVRARLKSTYRYRMAGALLAMLVVGFMLLLPLSGATNPGQLGKSIFEVLAWLSFLYCVLEGVRNTTDCLSQEKRSGTLGLLFLTDLKGYDVVLGKLMATSLNSFYTLFAVLPLIAISMLMGGVTAGEFWRLALVLVLTLFYSLNIGLCISAISREERRAWSGSWLVLLLLMFYPLLTQGLSFWPRSPLDFASPTLAFGNYSDLKYTASGSRLFWNSTVGTLAISWVLLILASTLLPRTWQEGTKQERKWWHSLTRWTSNHPLNPRVREQLLQRNPVLWMASRDYSQVLLLWTVVCSSAVIAICIYAATGGAPPTDGFLLAAALVMHLLLAIWAAARASFAFGDSRASGALELLLATPLTVKEIIEGHYLALRRQFMGPVLTLVVVEVGLLAAHLLRGTSSGLDPFESLMIVAIAGFVILVLILNLHAVGWYGLWMGLSCKKASHAVTRTVLFVIALPLVCGSPCNILLPVLWLVKDLIFINYAQNQLRLLFRRIVTEQFRPKAEEWPLIDLRAGPPQLPPVLP